MKVSKLRKRERERKINKEVRLFNKTFLYSRALYNQY